MRKTKPNDLSYLKSLGATAVQDSGADVRDGRLAADVVVGVAVGRALAVVVVARPAARGLLLARLLALVVVAVVIPAASRVIKSFIISFTTEVSYQMRSVTFPPRQLLSFQRTAALAAVPEMRTRVRRATVRPAKVFIAAVEWDFSQIDLEKCGHVNN